MYLSGVTERKLPACPQCPPCKSLHKPFSLPASRLFQALQHSHTFLDNLTSLEALLWGGHHVCSHLARPPMPEPLFCQPFHPSVLPSCGRKGDPKASADSIYHSYAEGNQPWPGQAGMCKKVNESAKRNGKESCSFCSSWAG